VPKEQLYKVFAMLVLTRL